MAIDLIRTMLSKPAFCVREKWCRPTGGRAKNRAEKDKKQEYGAVREGSQESHRDPFLAGIQQPLTGWEEGKPSLACVLASFLYTPSPPSSLTGPHLSCNLTLGILPPTTSIPEPVWTRDPGGKFLRASRRCWWRFCSLWLELECESFKQVL